MLKKDYPQETKIKRVKLSLQCHRQAMLFLHTQKLKTSVILPRIHRKLAIQFQRYIVNTYDIVDTGPNLIFEQIREYVHLKKFVLENLKMPADAELLAD